MKATTDLSILMPVYNERATIARAIERALEAELPVSGRELVVVDDGSTDGTREVLTGREWPPEVRVALSERNRGKGAGVRRALAEARGAYAAILDADLEYDPRDLAPLLEPLLAGEAQAVFGTRMFRSHSAYGFWYVLGNRAINLTANVLYNSWISDILSCYKAMPTELLRSLALREDGFGIDAEICARLLRAGVPIYEVPVTYRARSRAEGKKLRARDGVDALGALLRCRVT